eukprot:TRINITY_DN14908_c0_g2_i1.p1 TRINITY_DN14908_c0_g2~~TRINITY_DN14908_c0_g2_i1.p1  ORF type:complete len:530 (+),score=123.04 TRINITY_DN14908_c0_g2_i1:136-1725(+)
MAETPAEAGLTCVTWNVAAINNNPFEYWVTHDDEAYGRLMEDVQQFIDAPTAEQDAEVGTVFTDALFEELAEAMLAEGWQGVEETRQLWRADYSKRRIISGFLKDKQIGSKRLASMPDRLTNSIGLVDGGLTCRPTVISNFDAPLPDVRSWWVAWRSFMFEREIEVPSKNGPKRTRPCALLSPLSRAKYPAVTEAEELISIPLQALCCAIFDVVLVHMLNTVAPETWHGVKAALCKSLLTNKVALTLKILEDQYSDADVIFLQECAAAFTSAIRGSDVLASRFLLLAPAELDAKRDQNSLILASRRRFRVEAAEEITSQVYSFITGTGLATGDLCAMRVPPAQDDPDQTPYLLASFHGDTDGLMTLPVLQAVNKLRHSIADAGDGSKLRLIFGLDANAYCRGVDGKRLDAAALGAACEAWGLADCWSGHAARDPHQCCTTFNARTYLQPQLNKAVSRTRAGADANTDRNPKDYIIFDAAQFGAAGFPERDNTGKRGSFDPEVPFPTLHFPSDHAALLSQLRPTVPNADL